MRALNLYTDLVLLVLLLVGGIVFVPSFYKETRVSYVSFYDDKTLIYPEGEMALDGSRIREVEVSPGKYEYCQVYNGKMVALMLLIQDEYCPVNNVEINGTTYNFDENWMYERYDKIEATYYSTLAPIMSSDLLVKYRPSVGYWDYEDNLITGRMYKYSKLEGDYWVYSN